MFALTLNPGFVPILAAFAALAAPRGFGAPTIAGSALIALWLLLDREFGAAAAMAQMGLPVVLLNLDPLNRIFGIAALIGLIVIAPYAQARQNRYEDAAILLTAGGMVSALFVGDLVSFVAATALSGLAAAWVTFASETEAAGRAGVRLLIWRGLEGLLFLVGVAFHLTSGAQSSMFARLDLNSIGGVFIFAALMVRVGAPLAHVWLKDAISHATPFGGAALSAFSTAIGIYALARLFPSETALNPIGATMMIVGVFFASADDDMRRAAAYAQTAQTGVCVALVGVGSPLALAAAEGSAFAATFAFLTLQLALGNVVAVLGHANASGFAGLSRTMPVTALLIVTGGVAAAAAPGMASYAAHAVALEAAAPWDLRALWVLIAGLSGALFAGLALRPALAMFAPPTRQLRRREAQFTMILSGVLAGFFCISIGLAPRWLYDLMPGDLLFEPFALDRLGRQWELLGAAGVIYLGAYVLGVAHRERPVRLLDVDALYRGPVSGAARWVGVVLLRISGAGDELGRRVGAMAGQLLDAAARSLDQPYRQHLPGLVNWASLAAILALILAAQTW